MEAKSLDQSFNNVNLGPSYFDSIPDELTEIILKSLPINDQLATEGVCRKWKELVNSGTLRVEYLPPHGSGWSITSPEFYSPFYNVGIDDIGGCYMGRDYMGGGYKLPNIVTKEREISKKLTNKVYKVINKAYFEQGKTEKEEQKIKDKIKEAIKNLVWESTDLNHEMSQEAKLLKFFNNNEMHHQIFIPSDIPSNDIISDENYSISYENINSNADYVDIKLPPSFMELVHQFYSTRERYTKIADEIAAELKTNFEEINKEIEFIKT